jgi:glyoxalase family protein
MDNRILGIHHITAIAGNAKRNYDFYTKVLGLRMVKKTVNFDDPGTYHFYFGDEGGSPGTILTFFPWGERVKKGYNGTGITTEITYSVPPGSFDFWMKRFEKYQVPVIDKGKRFGEDYVSFTDPDGLNLTLLIPSKDDNRVAWETFEVKKEVGLKGFHSITLNLRNNAPTAQILTEIFDYKLIGTEGNRSRYETNAVDTASVVDLVENPSGAPAVNAGGTIHHVAFRVKDEETLMAFREKIVKKGFNITQKIDRNYFFSLYFREPNGVLFEIATDNPGFAVDEELSTLGSTLKLPAQYEEHRSEIEKVLPSIV